MRLSMTSILAYILAISLGISLVGFVGFHSYLVLTGSTTIEIQTYGRNNPYDSGMGQNWRSVFGKSRKRWFLPVPSREVRSTVHLEDLFDEASSLQEEEEWDDSLI